ncbi:MAG TPA: hypothetical protein VK590_08575, partial [Saprospiraceae bacterium]|nr:hypothetical protein [Saprospiraceae bacterium]
YKKEKKIESRFSINKISPFEKVRKGDVVLLKESGSFVTGVFVAGEVKFYHNVNVKILSEIENKYGTDICSHYDSHFWENRAKANYISLIEVKKVKRLVPFKSEKSDRTGWSILREGIAENLFLQKI